ncbi:MAG: hypothetical protein DME02_04135 [Candidatus Rokuibacteriota bacterium]|nr:MAG: hypothetical protein DME02_04135 [Candidatus Rokubacteria bacterium]
MSTTIKAGGLLLITALLLPPIASAQQTYNGAKPMVCAMSHVMECDDMGQCERRTPEAKALPRFVRVDTEKRSLSAVDGPRTTEIKSVSRTEGRLLLQGGEMGRGWSAAIAEDTGLMAVAVVDHDVTFSVFGACMIP